MNISKRLEQMPVSRFHYMLLLFAGLGWMFDSMDTGIISFVLPALMSSWSLSPEQVGFISSMGLAGMALGAILSGTIADRIGRKKVFATTLVIYSLATGLCGLSWNYPSLLVFRFLVGFGLGGQLPVAMTLVSEFSPLRHRGKFLVLLESFWAFGWLLAALIAYSIIPRFGWPIAFFIGALPALYVFILWRKIPESPRYLERKGRLKEAEEVVSRIEKQSGLIPSLLSSSQESFHLPADPDLKFSWRDLLGSAYLRRTIFLWILWFGVVFSYYGIFNWLPSVLALNGFALAKSYSYIIVITLAQIPGYFSAAYLVDKLGRKPTLTIYLLGTAVFAFLFGQAASNAMILIAGSIMSFFNLGAWGVMYTYTPELYPTHARATGSGWAAGIGRIGGILAPIIVGWMLGLKMTTGTVFIMFAIVLIVTALNVLVLGEETKARSLDEITAQN